MEIMAAASTKRIIANDAEIKKGCCRINMLEQPAQKIGNSKANRPLKRSCSGFFGGRFLCAQVGGEAAGRGGAAGRYAVCEPELVNRFIQNLAGDC